MTKKKVLGLCGRVQVPTDGIVHDPRNAADLVTFMRMHEEFQNRRYSPDEKRHFLRKYARTL